MRRALVATTRAEWRQVTSSRRLPFALAASALLTLALGGAAAWNHRQLAAQGVVDLDSVGAGRELLTNASVMYFVAALTAMVVVAGDRRLGVAATTSLFSPRPSVRMYAKLIVVVVTAVAIAMVGVAIALAITLVTIGGSGLGALGVRQVVGLVAGLMVGAICWGLIGAGIAAATGNLVATAVGYFAWLLGGEALVAGALPDPWGAVLPGGDPTWALTGEASALDVTGPQAAAMLAAWTIGVVAVGAALSIRRRA